MSKPVFNAWGYRSEDIRKYELTPQYKDSESLTTNNHEILGEIASQNFKSETLNTDQLGFRQSYSHDKEPLQWNSFIQLEHKKGVVLGNSLAYGIGTDHDHSCFNNQFNLKENEVSLYNLSLSHSNTQQEASTLLSLPDCKLDVIFWISGFNDINFLFRAYANFLTKENDSDPTNPSLGYKEQWQHSFNQVIDGFKKAVQTFKLSSYQNTPIHFILQPVIPWIDKELCEQELELIDIYDHAEYFSLRKSLPKMAHTIYQDYQSNIKNICHYNNISFIDGNLWKELKSNQWLFTDRLHLNNEGHKIVADKCIKMISTLSEQKKFKKSYLQNTLNKLNPDLVTRLPYPHIEINSFIDEKLYRELEDNIPSNDQLVSIDTIGRASGYSNRHVMVLHQHDFSFLPEDMCKFWSNFSSMLLSQEFKQACFDLYKEEFKEREVRIDDGVAEAMFMRDFKGYQIGPHTDIPDRFLTLMFYLPKTGQPEDLGTSVYLPKDPNFKCSNGKHYPLEHFNTLMTSKYIKNNAFLFLRTDNSFHGREELSEEIERDTIVYMIRRKK